ncbi:hypothetical protein [Micromonospora musae]|uniref:hypothetical protein n=1 Tax=Micromonospora musae TaxID=1894970 RepID=UPI0033E06D9C
MIDQHPDAAAVAPVDPPRRHPRRRLLALGVALLALALLGFVGVLAYQHLTATDDEDSGVRACRAAEVLTRADGGDVADAQLLELATGFKNSRHPDLQDAGVTAAGLVARVQRTRDEAYPGSALYEASLRVAIPRLVTACRAHGVTVGG